jgi:hypothetical protein
MMIYNGKVSCLIKIKHYKEIVMNKTNNGKNSTHPIKMIHCIGPVLQILQVIASNRLYKL